MNRQIKKITPKPIKKPKKVKLYFTMEEFASLIKERMMQNDPSSYTCWLTSLGVEKIVKKIAEEAMEVGLAAFEDSYKNSPKTKQHLIDESCDLIYHLFLLLAHKKIDFNSILEELALRSRKEFNIKRI